jgi:hypothetical protein
MIKTNIHTYLVKLSGKSHSRFLIRFYNFTIKINNRLLLIKLITYFYIIAILL